MINLKLVDVQKIIQKKIINNAFHYCISVTERMMYTHNFGDKKNDEILLFSELFSISMPLCLKEKSQQYCTML